MEVKIKQGNEMLEATIEMVDGVMVVSPKKEKADVTKFNDGDIITCGWDCNNKSYNWISILCGEIECISDNMFIGDYCSLDCKGDFLDHNSGSDSATWVRYATEEEKQKLFDKLKEEGYEFDFEKKELVKLKWKPKYKEPYFAPFFSNVDFLFSTCSHIYTEHFSYELTSKLTRVFKTDKECQAFCDRLNDAINSVKP